jgi:hypothetical protein
MAEGAKKRDPPGEAKKSSAVDSLRPPTARRYLTVDPCPWPDDEAVAGLAAQLLLRALTGAAASAPPTVVATWGKTLATSLRSLAPDPDSGVAWVASAPTFSPPEGPWRLLARKSRPNTRWRFWNGQNYGIGIVAWFGETIFVAFERLPLAREIPGRLYSLVEVDLTSVGPTASTFIIRPIAASPPQTYTGE